VRLAHFYTRLAGDRCNYRHFAACIGLRSAAITPISLCFNYLSAEPTSHVPRQRQRRCPRQPMAAQGKASKCKLCGCGCLLKLCTNYVPRRRRRTKALNASACAVIIVIIMLIARLGALEFEADAIFHRGRIIFSPFACVCVRTLICNKCHCRVECESPLSFEF